MSEENPQALEERTIDAILARQAALEALVFVAFSELLAETQVLEEKAKFAGFHKRHALARLAEKTPPLTAATKAIAEETVSRVLAPFFEK